MSFLRLPAIVEAIWTTILRHAFNLVVILVEQIIVCMFILVLSQLILTSLLVPEREMIRFLLVMVIFEMLSFFVTRIALRALLSVTVLATAVFFLSTF